MSYPTSAELAGTVNSSSHNGRKPTTRILSGLALSSIIFANTISLPAVLAKTSTDNTQPSGTLLIPISPKISVPGDSSSQSNTNTSTAPSSTSQASSTPVGISSAIPTLMKETPQAETAEETNKSTTGNDDEPTLTEPGEATKQDTAISPELGKQDAEIGEDTTLKGTIQLVADDTEYDQDKNTFLGSGNAVVIIDGQNSKIEADTILYDQNSQMIDARGNVHIYRNGQLTLGSAFKFNATSDEYLITNPDTAVNGSLVVARLGYGKGDALAFRNGTMLLPQPLHMVNNYNYGPNPQDNMDRIAHPDAYIPSKPSYTFTARRMVYERYKDADNLTIFGGKLRFGNFDMPIPIPKATLTVGGENSRVVFPITPLITNNMQMGGTSFGPSFNIAEGKFGVFSIAPMIQMGGTTTNSTTNWNKSPGVGIRLGYRDEKMNAHLAYGSVSNMLVADLKYRFTRKLKFQGGINRYLDDGIYGMRRARLLAELVYNKNISNVPYLAYINFRTSGGWMQDDPALLNNTSSAYSQLFTVKPFQGKVAGYRIQEQVSAATHPFISIGDDKYGFKTFVYGGVASKAYSTGNTMTMGQMGPVLDLRLNRLRLRAGYTQAAVTGASPFVFDEFIQGTRSAYLGGDLRLCKWVTLGGTLGYNLVAKEVYQKTVSAAIGPSDFKVLLSHDILTGYDRYGFDLLFGQPIPFNRLSFKQNADQGQLGGI